MSTDYLYSYLNKLVNANHVNDIMFLLTELRNPSTINIIRSLYRNKEMPREIENFLKLQEI